MSLAYTFRAHVEWNKCYDFHNRLWTDEDVWMISVETPMVFAKACEMFMKKLTMRGWANVEIHKGNMILSLGM
ncbi:hypothetical protein AAZX31_01G051100 [Glycine max]